MRRRAPARVPRAAPSRRRRAARASRTRAGPRAATRRSFPCRGWRSCARRRPCAQCSMRGRARRPEPPRPPTREMWLLAARLERDAVAERPVLLHERGLAGVQLGLARLHGGDRRLLLLGDGRPRLLRRALAEGVRVVVVRAVELRERLAVVVGCEAGVVGLGLARRRRRQLGGRLRLRLHRDAPAARPASRPVSSQRRTCRTRSCRPCRFRRTGRTSCRRASTRTSYPTAPPNTAT